MVASVSAASSVRTSGAALLASAVVSSCGGAAALRSAGSCVPIANTVDSASLVMDQTLRVDPPCTESGHVHLRAPVRLTATAQGLRIEMDIADVRYRPGAYRQARGERDVVVVFPAGEAAGRGFVELAATPTTTGYQVDDTVPWEAWRLTDGQGSFRWQCVVFEREEDGDEHEVRLSMHLTLREPAQAPPQPTAPQAAAPQTPPQPTAAH